MIIHPTIGRVVWYYPSGAASKQRGDQPWAALVAYVHSDICVNLGGFDPNGKHFEATSVTLRQPEESDPEHGAFCEWMPFQAAQAAKYAAEDAQKVSSAGSAAQEGIARPI